MSKSDAERRAEIIARLEVLQHEVGIQSLIFHELVNEDSTPTLATKTHPWHIGWPFDGCRELWQASVPLVRDGRFIESEADGGSASWLRSHAQQFIGVAGGSSRLANPIKVWLDGIRNPSSGGPDVVSAILVSGDPRCATTLDLAAVSDKARLLVGVFRQSHEEILKLEKYIRDLRPRDGEKLLPNEEQYLKMQQYTLRWAEWNWNLWWIYADVVWHYCSNLLPVDLAECRQVSRRLWLRPTEIDWPEIEKEFDRLASKLQWVEVKTPAKEVNPMSDSVPPQTQAKPLVINRQRLRRSLQSARDELALARQQATAFGDLSTRSWRAAVQACRALHADVWLDIPILPPCEMWSFVTKRPDEWTDNEAFNWWTIAVCPWVRSTSTVWAGGAGHFDFSPVRRNEAGKLVDRDGNELKLVTEPDGSMHWSGETVSEMELENQTQQMSRMQLRAKDWLDTIDRLVEMVDALPAIEMISPSPTGQVGHIPVAEPLDSDNGSLILNDTLLGIMNALDGVALRVEQLAKKVTGGETTRLYRDGLKTVLVKRGMIVLDRRIGYFRPDKPPKNRVAKVAK